VDIALQWKSSTAGDRIVLLIAPAADRAA